MTKLTIGIDVSKDHLDSHCLAEASSHRWANSACGLKALCAWLQTKQPALIVFEATGVYHRRLERSLAQANIAFAKVNPRQARRFAEATGTLAKTDRVDARMLARFGAMLEPAATNTRGQALEALGELVTARRALIKDRTATRNRQKNLSSKLLSRQAKQRLKQIKADIAAIEAECRKRIQADQDLARRFEILLSIKGLGDVAAITLIAEMPELGAMDKRQAAALAGLAPITRQSGTWRGKSFIKGGRPKARQVLYMPALVAIRFNPQLKAKYRAMIKAGKPFKVAITAIMRKLITIANALIRDHRKYDQVST